MRDAEEVARDMYAAAEQTYDDLRELGPKMGPGKMRERMIYAIATHLRARDAEVRADERAKVLAGFTEERRGRTQTTTTVMRPGTRERRFVGPWEPVP